MLAVFVCLTEKSYHYAAQAGLELMIFWPQPPKCWNYRHMPLYPALFLISFLAGPWWLRPIILAILEVKIRRIEVRSQPRQIVHETLSANYQSQKGLAEWLKVKALSSSPITEKKKSFLKEK
jgi:hypothetical protein